MYATFSPPTSATWIDELPSYIRYVRAVTSARLASSLPKRFTGLETAQGQPSVASPTISNMFSLRHGSTRAASRSLLYPKRLSRRWYAIERTQIKIPHAPRPASPFPVIESCPSPTCQCRDMPEGLDIEKEQILNGSMAAYAEQILISTGKSDWKSRIEDEEGTHGDAVRGLKGLLGPRGKFSDVGEDPSNADDGHRLSISPPAIS